MTDRETLQVKTTDPNKSFRVVTKEEFLTFKGPIPVLGRPTYEYFEDSSGGQFFRLLKDASPQAFLTMVAKGFLNTCDVVMVENHKGVELEYFSYKPPLKQFEEKEGFTREQVIAQFMVLAVLFGDGDKIFSNGTPEGHNWNNYGFDFQVYDLQHYVEYFTGKTKYLLSTFKSDVLGDIDPLNVDKKKVHAEVMRILKEMYDFYVPKEGQSKDKINQHLLDIVNMMKGKGAKKIFPKDVNSLRTFQRIFFKRLIYLQNPDIISLNLGI